MDKLIWFFFVLWHINFRELFNAKANLVEEPIFVGIRGFIYFQKLTYMNYLYQIGILSTKTQHKKVNMNVQYILFPALLLLNQLRRVDVPLKYIN